MLFWKQNFICEHIYFYTAPPFQNENPTQEDRKRYSRYESFKNKLSKDKIISIREGRCQRLKVDGKYIYNQKAVDVLLATDLTNVLVKFPRIKKIILEHRKLYKEIPYK